MAVTDVLALAPLSPNNKPSTLASLKRRLRIGDDREAETAYDDILIGIARKPYPSLAGLRNRGSIRIGMWSMSWRGWPLPETVESPSFGESTRRVWSNGRMRSNWSLRDLTCSMIYSGEAVGVSGEGYRHNRKDAPGTSGLDH